MPKSSGPTNRRQSKKVATPEQIAALKFEPCQHSPDEWRPPSNEEWSAAGGDVLPFVRSAWLMMYKTKDEIGTIAKDLSVESLEGTWNGIIHAQEFFESFVTVLKAAEIRLMSAAASASVSAPKDH